MQRLRLLGLQCRRILPSQPRQDNLRPLGGGLASLWSHASSAVGEGWGPEL